MCIFLQQICIPATCKKLPSLALYLLLRFNWEHLQNWVWGIFFLFTFISCLVIGVFTDTSFRFYSYSSCGKH